MNYLDGYGWLRIMIFSVAVNSIGCIIHEFVYQKAHSQGKSIRQTLLNILSIFLFGLFLFGPMALVPNVFKGQWSLGNFFQNIRQEEIIFGLLIQLLSFIVVWIWVVNSILVRRWAGNH